MIHKQLYKRSKWSEDLTTNSSIAQEIFVPQHLVQEFYNIMSQCMAFFDEAPVVLQPSANQQGFWILDSKASRIWSAYQSAIEQSK